MNTGGDAAEQVVRLSLEGMEVAARLSGSAAKNVSILIIAALKQQTKTAGKARLSSMIRSGKELKVFSLENKDVERFCKEAKRYGVLFTVLKDRNSKGPNVPVDIIARTEDASKISRIMERFEFGRIDPKQIPVLKEEEVDAVALTAEEVIEEALKERGQKEKEAPLGKEREKKPPFERDSGSERTGAKASVKEKLEHFRKEKPKAEKTPRVPKPRERG